MGEVTKKFQYKVEFTKEQVASKMLNQIDLPEELRHLDADTFLTMDRAGNIGITIERIIKEEVKPKWGK